MTTFLLIIITAMVLVTMVCSLITTIIEVKNKKEQDLVKKVLTIVSIIVVVIAVIGLAFGVSSIKKDNGSNSSSAQTNDVALEEAGFNEIDLDEYQELLKGQEKSIILIARPTCGYCEAFAPILSQASEDMKLEINYLDTDKFSSEDWNTFNSSLDYLSNESWGTPLTLIVQNGELVDKNNGYVELDDIKSFFKNNGYGE